MKTSRIVLLGVVIGIGSFSYHAYRDLQQQQQDLSEKIADLNKCILDSKVQSSVDQVNSIEQVITQAELWRPVQEKIKDTVVQVFSQIAEFDWVQPYRTPAQYSACGSAFFINEEGHLITNAHVVDQTNAIWIQTPSLGKRMCTATVIGVSPERDIALLKLDAKDVEALRAQLGAIPYLTLGDSDQVHRAQEVLALGYPLGQQSLKSTTGVISGTENCLLQIDAAINPGSSGGPLVNKHGEVIGINRAGVIEAQNVGYAIPVSELKAIKDDLYKVKLLRKPYLGVLFTKATDELTEYLANPAPGGCYVTEVVKGSMLDKAGVKRGDMIYEIDGHHVDIYGEMSVPWSEDKVSITDYVSRISIGQDVQLVSYRNGTRKEFSIKFSQSALPAIRHFYPGYEEIDYLVFGGMVLMNLTLNHIQIMGSKVTGLTRHAELQNQSEEAVLITHVFATSQLARSRTITAGTTISEINGLPVKNLNDVRAAIKAGANGKYLTIKAVDNVARASDNVLVVLPLDKIYQEERQLAHDYHFAHCGLVQDLLKGYEARQAIQPTKLAMVQ